MANAILDLQQGASVGDQAGSLSRLKGRSWDPQSAWSKRDVNGNVRSQRSLGYSRTCSARVTEAPCAAHVSIHTMAISDYGIASILSAPFYHAQHGSWQLIGTIGR